MLEVADGGAFAQEFRVRHHRAIAIGPGLADDALDFVAGAHGHRRFGDDHGEAVERARDLARRVIDETQIGVAVAAPRRRADRDEHRVGGANRGRQLRAEFEPSGARVDRHQLVEPRLVDRHLAAFERGDLDLVLVDAGHFVTEIGKAGPGNEADIAGADHGNAHACPLRRWRTNSGFSRRRLHSRGRRKWREPRSVPQGARWRID